MPDLGFQMSFTNLWDPFPKRFTGFYSFSDKKNLICLCRPLCTCVLHRWEIPGEERAAGLPLCCPNRMDSVGTRSYLIGGQVRRRFALRRPAVGVGLQQAPEIQVVCADGGSTSFSYPS